MFYEVELNNCQMSDLKSYEFLLVQHLQVEKFLAKVFPLKKSQILFVFILDTLTERDSLIENIFPKLKDYCREKYGLEFQVC